MQLTRQARETLLQKLRGSYVSSVLSNLSLFVCVQLTRQARETLLQKLRGSYVSSVLSNLYDCMVANIESRDGALVSDVLRPLVLAGATQLQLSSADVLV